jgi:hypothetical protein
MPSHDEGTFVLSKRRVHLQACSGFHHDRDLDLAIVDRTESFRITIKSHFCIDTKKRIMSPTRHQAGLPFIEKPPHGGGCKAIKINLYGKTGMIIISPGKK